MLKGLFHHSSAIRPRRSCPGWALEICLAVLLLSGCAHWQGETTAQLPADLPDTWHTRIAPADLPITNSLLDLIDTPQAHQLVMEALANNPDLRATALRLKSAGYLSAVPQADRLPQVTGGYEVRRHNQDINPFSGRRQTADVQRIALGVSWELDIWGRLADESAAALEQHQARAWAYQHASDALATRVLQAWIELIATRRSIQISEARLAALEAIERVLKDRYRSGLGNLDELDTARTRTAVAQADLSELTADRRVLLGQLEVLLGRYPRGELLTHGELPIIASPPTTLLPATVLLLRPDIQAALASVEAARYRSRAARKARLPNLTLSGQVFRESVRLDNLGGGTANWNLLGALFQPIFDGGRLRNTSRAQAAEAQAVLMDLRVQVLQALKEVEDALVFEKALARQVTALRQAVSAAAKSSQFYERRYRQGLDSLQSLLIAREQAVFVKLRLNRVEAACLRNRIDLALALGAGATPSSHTSGGDAHDTQG